MKKENRFGQEYYPKMDSTGRFTWCTHCFSCGTEVTVNLHMKNKVYCNRCRIENIRQEREAKEIDDLLKYEIRFQQGIGLLEAKIKDISKFTDAINLAKSKIRRYGSTDEVLAAIVLLHCKHKILIQQKIGKYQADFLLPDEKLIVEIDGKPFHSDKRKELERDNYISLRMGIGWEVVHIPTDVLRKNPMALDNVIKQYRLQNVGG